MVPGWQATQPASPTEGVVPLGHCRQPPPYASLRWYNPREASHPATQACRLASYA